MAQTRMYARQYVETPRWWVAAEKGGQNIPNICKWCEEKKDRLKYGWHESFLLTQKSTHWNPRANVRQARKIDQAYQSILPVDWQGDRVNVKFEGISAGVPIIPQIDVSASFADTIHDKRIFKCKRVINECVGRISQCTRRQNRLWVADRACTAKSKLRMCNSDDAC